LKDSSAVKHQGNHEQRVAGWNNECNVSFKCNKNGNEKNHPTKVTKHTHTPTLMKKKKTKVVMGSLVCVHLMLLMIVWNVGLRHSACACLPLFLSINILFLSLSKKALSQWPEHACLSSSSLFWCFLILLFLVSLCFVAFVDRWGLAERDHRFHPSCGCAFMKWHEYPHGTTRWGVKIHERRWFDEHLEDLDDSKQLKYNQSWIKKLGLSENDGWSKL
jgi:hypothetical protein